MDIFTVKRFLRVTAHLQDYYDTELESSCTCGGKTVFTVHGNDLKKWAAGKGLVQDLFNYLTEDHREKLISGTCNKCWDELFAEDEVAEDEDD